MDNLFSTHFRFQDSFFVIFPEDQNLISALNETLQIVDCTETKHMNYNNRRFRPVSNSENGEISSEMIFHYQQAGNILTCEYQGLHILKGHLLGLVDEKGNIEMRYHQINQNGDLMTGICQSKPELMENGKLRLHEVWQWTSGDGSKGKSVLEEV